MACHKRGRQSFVLPELPVITAWASVAGKKESEGPLARTYDLTSQDTLFGQKTWEQAEKQMQQLALQRLAQKAGLHRRDFDLVLSGDLLNQCITSSMSLKNTGIPHLGLYGACSTMAEALVLGAMAVGGGFADRVVAQTSSHFAASERQYRFPLGYGGQRTPTSQWTVTGAGAVLLQSGGIGPRIESCTVGAVTDLGVKDPGNMGCAMAPAVFHTVCAHLEDLHRQITDFDLIVTGDLGQLGKEVLAEMAAREGLPLGERLTDCGTLVFDNAIQGVNSGGSGCGCSAIALCGYLLSKLQAGEFRRILFCGTGALLSPLSTQQGQSIPGICHAVSIISGRD